MTRIIIKDMTLEEAEIFFQEMGEAKYRGKQLFNWMYERNIETFDEMTNFSKKFRLHLKEHCVLSPLKVADRQKSEIDGTEKFLFETMDGHYIESVLLRNDTTDDGRLTVCISSQVGCQMGCRYCQTAKIGFKRNLSAGEIIDQLCHVRRLTGLRNNNIVFMGMGEPFMNYDNVMRAADIMNYSFGFHISVRKITISTCGVLDRLEQYIDEKRPYNVAISLNDTEPHKRKENMPVEKKFPFQEIADLLRRKFPVSRNRLTIEYVMRNDNISPGDARRLKKMFKYGRVKLNLIPLNRGDHNYDVPTREAMDQFISELEQMNIPISVRKSLGSDIDGACGQLSGRRYNT